MASKFRTGQLVWTCSVNAEVDGNPDFAKFVTGSLKRHMAGDWGNLCAEDRAENNQGLVRGFLYAGTPAVLTSLWTMDEGPTAEFMSTLYGALRDRASRAAAVRQAQLEAKSRMRHPYHWAGFVLNGAW